VRAQIVVHGGRDLVGVAPPGDEKEHLSRRQDICISIRDKDGKLQRIPNVEEMTLRVGPRGVIATCEIVVDDIEVTGVWLEEIREHTR